MESVNSILKFDPRLHKSQPSLGSRTSAYFLMCHAWKLFFTFSYLTTRLLFPSFIIFLWKLNFSQEIITVFPYKKSTKVKSTLACTRWSRSGWYPCAGKTGNRRDLGFFAGCSLPQGDLSQPRFHRSATLKKCDFGIKTAFRQGSNFGGRRFSNYFRYPKCKSDKSFSTHEIFFISKEKNILDKKIFYMIF